MRSVTIFPPQGPLPADAVVDDRQPDLHLVEPKRRERADVAQQRHAFEVRCGRIADLLSRTELLEDRIELYRQGIFSARELSTAAALYPELMPVLNGEWEWIALTLADNEDD